MHSIWRRLLHPDRAPAGIISGIVADSIKLGGD
jgi:hypothetical protein